ncbi:hypothetical protein [Thioalkalivibrio denitrificans]|uniref:hypothetical protein n=1 Tax=Thioalkalivibrio denitrificans TaxID=108003 RepID=UPI00111568B5|nr:hypothetical protein [Thioalkalivibrio denitrificans]
MNPDWCARGAPGPARVLTLLALLAVSSSAWAGKVELIDIQEDLSQSTMTAAGLNTQYPVPGPVIKVLSHDGEHYHEAQGGTLDFGVWAQSMCSFGSLDSEVKLEIGPHSEVLASGTGGSFFADLIAGKQVSVTTAYQSPSLPHSPVAACNNRLVQLENAGVPRWQALQEGFAIQVDNAYSARLRVSCGAVIVGTDERTALLRGWVHCMPSALAEAPPEPPPPPPEPGAADLQQPFGVTAASVFLPQSIKTAACPTQLLAQANITTTGPGTVQYRWVHNNAEGPVASVTFHQGGTAKLETHLTVGAPAQGGFAPTPGGGTGGGFGMVQQPGGENQVQGYVRVKIVDTPGVQISDAVHYTVTCDATHGADGLAATPTPQPPPMPQVSLGSGQLGVPAQPPLPGSAREAAPAGSRQMARPAEPVTPAGRPDTPRAAVAPRMTPAARCPFEREAMCRVGGAWQNCCTLSDAGRIIPPAPADPPASLRVPLADSACVRRCASAGQGDERARAACYERCSVPGAQLP